MVRREPIDRAWRVRVETGWPSAYMLHHLFPDACDARPSWWVVVGREWNVSGCMARISCAERESEARERALFS
jgi:hypothetical protein